MSNPRFTITPIGQTILEDARATLANARRYEHALKNGFPVRTQDGRWVAFADQHRAVFADTPNEALDEAIRMQPLRPFAHHHYQQNVERYDLVDHIARQREWSSQTFGPGTRVVGLLDHIKKELDEIAYNPNDLMEWIDVVILALDGAWRSGASPEKIANALRDKQSINEQRRWPDWRTADPDKAIEHDRSGE